MPRAVGISFSKWNGTLPTGHFRVEVGAGRSPELAGVSSILLTVRLELDARTAAASPDDRVMRQARESALEVDPSHLASMDEP
jgi:hypothetical protein